MEPNHPPFKVNKNDFPSNALRSFFNMKNCFAQGNYSVVKGGHHIALDGDCRIIQFGINPEQGKHCMFALDVNVSPSDPNPMMVAMSFQFDDMGRVDDVRFGNGSWIPDVNSINMPNGTQASFGHLPVKSRTYGALDQDDKAKVDAIDVRLKKEISTLTTSDREALTLAKINIMQPPPTWGCIRVLKGSFDFIGCEQHTMPGNRSFRVPCVRSVNLNETERGFFEHKFGGVSRYGTNQHDAAGVGLFVYSKPYGTITSPAAETSAAISIENRRSELAQEDRTRSEAKLKEYEASLQMDKMALRWLALNPLMFPPGDITQPFVNDAFEWVNKLSMQFKKPYVSALNPRFPNRTPQALAPGMSRHVFDLLTVMPTESRHLNPVMPCKCTPTKHDPICKNRICPWYVAFESGRFVWPPFEFHPNAAQYDLKKKQTEDMQKRLEEAEAAFIKKAEERELAAEAAKAHAAAARAKEAKEAKEAAKVKASAAQASAAQASAAQASISSRPRRLPASAAAVAAAAVATPASKRASSSSASAAKRSKPGGTRRRRRHRRRSIRR